MIQSKRTYTCLNSGLYIVVHKVLHVSDKGYIKFKASLFSKMGNILHETKNYKIPLRRISHWIPYNKVDKN